MPQSHNQITEAVHRGAPDPRSAPGGRFVFTTLLFLFLFALAEVAESQIPSGGSVVCWGDGANGKTTVPEDLGEVVAVSAGYLQTYALKPDGRVRAWGENSAGQITFAHTLSNIVAIDAAASFAVALRSDGTVVAWGTNTYGQTNVPANLTNVIAVSAGAHHCLALRSDGTVVAWGYDGYGATNIPVSFTNIASISAGHEFNLAVRSNHTISGWGTGSFIPGHIGALTNLIQVDASWNHSVGLQQDGTVVAWGSNSLGETNVPTDLTNCVAVQAIAGGNLAVKSDGSLLPWGSVGTPPSWLQAVMAVSGRYYHWAAITRMPVIRRSPVSQKVAANTEATFSFRVDSVDPLAYQWFFEGQPLLDATNATLTLPDVKVANVGNYHVIVSNAFGSATSSPALLGIDPLQALSHPRNTILRPGRPAVLQVVSGASFSYQWFFNNQPLPQGTEATLTLTNETTSAGYYWVVYSNSNTYTTVTSRPVAVVTPGLAMGWNSNSTNRFSYPEPVLGIARSRTHTAAITTNGTIIQWPNSIFRALTNPPASATNMIAVAVGNGFTVGLREDGRVITWGTPLSGVPMPANLTNVIAIAAVDNVVAALTENGDVIRWGGVGTPFSELTNAVAFSLGRTTASAIHPSGATTPTTVYGNVIARDTGLSSSIFLLRDRRAILGGQSYVGSNIVAVACDNGNYPNESYANFLMVRADGSVTRRGTYTNLPTDLRCPLVLDLYGEETVLVPREPSVFASDTNRVVSDGQSLVLAPSIGGVLPMFYQWSLNGTNIAGANDSSLSLEKIQSEDSGYYTLSVSNHWGASSATVRVQTRPTVPYLVARETFYPVAGKQSVTLKPDFSHGTEPVFYQWQLGGIAIPGATNYSLSLSNLGREDWGTYSLIASNHLGTAMMPAVVYPPMTVAHFGSTLNGVSAIPASATNITRVAAGGSHALAVKENGRVVAWGTNTYGQTDVPATLTNAVKVVAGFGSSMAICSNGTLVTWGVNPCASPYGSNPSNFVAAAIYKDEAVYLHSDGRVTGCSSSWSGYPFQFDATNVVRIAAGRQKMALRNDGSLIVWTNTSWGTSSILTNPATMTNIIDIAANEDTCFALRNNGVVIAWNPDFRDNVILMASNAVAITANQSGLAILKANGSVTGAQLGTIPTYLKPAYGLSIGNSDSSNYTLALWGGPAIVNQPASTNRLAGNSLSFTLNAIGAPRLYYQWKFNSTNLPGATNSTLSLSPLQPHRAGTYSAVVSNYLSVAETTNFVVTVPPLTLNWWTQTNRIVLAGTNVPFTAYVDSAAPVSFSWFHDGNQIPRTGSSINLLDVQLSQAGNYTVLASNVYGTVLSSPSRLAVTPMNASLEHAYLSNEFTFNWPEGYILQRAADVSGPYLDVTNATSPFILTELNGTNSFFRLRWAQ